MHYVNRGASTFRPWHYAETKDVWETLTGNESWAQVSRMAGFKRLAKAPLSAGPFALSRQYAVVEADTGRPVGNEEHGHAVVGEDFELFQPDECGEFCEALRANDSRVRYVSAGTLKGGRLSWVLADAGSLAVLKRPNGMLREHRKHLFIYNACDGSAKLTMQDTDTDVCCWNTASYALREETPYRWSTKHTRHMRDRLDVAAEALGFAMVAFEEQASFLQALNGLSMASLYGVRKPAEGMAVFASQLLLNVEDPQEAVEEARKLVAEKSRAASIFQSRAEQLAGLFFNGIGACGADAFDALSAVTEWIDHQKNRSKTWRAKAAGLGVGMDSAFLGNGADVKRRAVRLLQTRSGLVVPA
jgi:phage/plasmid-like protein (TIGR03299 family)